MNTIDLKLETTNKIKTGYITGTITAIDKVIQLITRLRNQTNTIAKKAYKELEEYGSASAYAIHR